jgi:hypothetical protein
MRTYNTPNNNRSSYYDDREDRSGRQARPDGNGRPRYEDERGNGYAPERQAADEPPNPTANLGDGWVAAHEAQVKHFTVNVWKRRGVSGLRAYSLTLTRTFYSERSGGYRTTSKLFAEDAPLAAEAFTAAAEWIRREAREEAPPF